MEHGFIEEPELGASAETPCPLCIHLVPSCGGSAWAFLQILLVHWDRSRNTSFGAWIARSIKEDLRSGGAFENAVPFFAVARFIRGRIFGGDLSKNQELTFEYLEKKFKDNQLTFDENKYKLLNIINEENNYFLLSNKLNSNNSIEIIYPLKDNNELAKELYDKLSTLTNGAK